MMTAKILNSVKNLYPHLSNAEIAGLVGISSATIVNWARKYGWKKSENFNEVHKVGCGRKRKVRENEPVHYDYWSMVKEFKIEQWETNGRNHPFYQPTQRQYKYTKETNGTN
jgi:uncharacterized protein YjcR